MAETEAPETLVKQQETEEAPVQEMDVEVQSDDTAAGDGCGAKRAREEEADAVEDGNDEAKKPKLEKSVEEERLEKAGEEEKKSDSDPEQAKVKVGPKSFESSVEMFDYFYKLLHSWTPNINVNKVNELNFFLFLRVYVHE